MYSHPVYNKNTQIVFIYSSHSRDQKIRKQLEAHLSGLNHLGVLMIWYELSTNTIYSFENIKNHNFDILNTADIVALFVTPEFIHLIQSTPSLYSQIQSILKRRLEKNITVVPLLIRPVHGWERDLPNLAPLPKDGAVVSSGQNRDEVLYAIAKGLEEIIDNQKKYQRNLQEYKHILIATIQNEYPFSYKTINYLNNVKINLELKNKDIELIEKGIFAKAEAEYTQKLYKYKQLFLTKILWKRNVDEQDRKYLRSIQLNLCLPDEDIAIIEQQVTQQNIVQRIYQIIYTRQPLSYILLAFIILLLIFSMREISILSNVQQRDQLLKQADNKLEIGNYEEAVQAYTKVIKIDPVNRKAYIGRGKALSFMNNYEAAIQDYTQAINKYPEAVLAYMDRAVVRCALGNRTGAIRDYQKAVNLYKQQGLIEGKTEAIKRLQELRQNQCPIIIPSANPSSS